MQPTTNDPRLDFLATAAGRGLTLQQIGSRLGVTRERARQLLNRYGLNSDRKTLRREAKIREWEAAADAADPYVEAVRALRGAGVVIHKVYVPLTYGNGGLRLEYRDDTGQRVHFRHAETISETYPGSHWWRAGSVRVKGEPHVLVTPQFIFYWQAPTAATLYAEADGQSSPRRRARGTAPDVVVAV